MRLSTSTCIYFNRPDGTKADICDSIKACGKAGYQVMDMNWHDCAVFSTPFWTDDWLEWVNHIKETADENHVTFNQSHAHFYNYCDTTLDNRSWLEETVRRSILGTEKLSAKWMVIHAASDWTSSRQLFDSKRKAIDYFKPIIEVAGEHGVGVAIENLWEMNIAPMRRYTSFPEELVDLVDSLPYDNVGICWDLEHTAIMQQDFQKTAQLFGPYLKTTHVSDYFDKVHDHVLPYHGVTDWDQAMKALASIDYTGDLTYETHRFTMNLPTELIPSALRYSVDVGNYLISRYTFYKEQKKNG